MSCRPPDDGSRSAPGAQATTHDVTIDIDLEAVPRVGPADVVVTIRDGGTPVDGATVELTGDMTHAGMVPVVDTMLPQGDGRYHSDAFAFDMAGDWILTADVRLPDGRRAMAEVARTVRRP